MKFKETLSKITERALSISSVFVSRATRSWKALIVVVFLMLAASIAFLTYAIQAPTYLSGGATPEGASSATSTGNVLERALDGMLVDASSTHLLPFGVMVENSADAWPLQGPAKANLVFEAPVEGSITRLLLFFDASTTVAEIGPVRSARPYFVEWADGLDAMYAHVGGSPDGLEEIASIPSFRDLNEFSNGWAFWRSAKRAAPHNVYTRTDLLLQAAEKKEYVPGSFSAWRYADASTSTEQTVDVERIRVPYEGIYAAEWRYDVDEQMYVRYRDGIPVRDADGAVVRARNVVILLTDAEVLDDIGRLKLRTTGRGSALVFSEGRKREAVWSRTSGSHLRFEGVDGSEIIFTRGTSWVSVVTSKDRFDTVLPEASNE